MFSVGPSTEQHNGNKHAIEKEISDAIFSITRRLHDLKSFQSSEEEEDSSSNGGAGVITVSGHNNGATMNIKSHGEEPKSFNLGHTSVHIYINNNVQGVNNSILYNSSCTLRDPGVHMDFSHIQSEKLGLIADSEKMSLIADSEKMSLIADSEKMSLIADSEKMGLDVGKEKLGLDVGKEKLGFNDDKMKMGYIADEDVEIRAKKGRKRSLSEVISDHEVPLCERETRPSESSSSVNAQICDGSSESIEQGSSVVEVTSMEIVKVESGHHKGAKKPSRLMGFTRKFLCSTNVVE